MLSKQPAVLIIHVNGTENENKDLQCNWQQEGCMLPVKSADFVFGHVELFTIQMASTVWKLDPIFSSFLNFLTYKLKPL